jgi:hypothetical protein
VEEPVWSSLAIHSYCLLEQLIWWFLLFCFGLVCFAAWARGTPTS